MASKIDDDEAERKLTRYWKFVYLVFGIVFFFGCHNYMQELIMSQPGFKVCSFWFFFLVNDFVKNGVT
jgi:hypothetical protein